MRTALYVGSDTPLPSHDAMLCSFILLSKPGFSFHSQQKTVKRDYFSFQEVHKLPQVLLCVHLWPRLPSFPVFLKTKRQNLSIEMLMASKLYNKTASPLGLGIIYT